MELSFSDGNLILTAKILRESFEFARVQAEAKESGYILTVDLEEGDDTEMHLSAPLRKRSRAAEKEEPATVNEDQPPTPGVTSHD